MSDRSIAVRFEAVAKETGESMRRLGETIAQYGAGLRAAPHLRPNGHRCYIAHSLDKPCPKWRGRNYP